MTLCLVFNHQLLTIINKPLKETTEQRTREGKGILGDIYVLDQAFKATIASNERILKSIAPDLKPEQQAVVEAELAKQQQIAAGIKPPNGAQPVTLGPGEPFSATFTVAFYFSLLLSMPLILYQLYMFVLPAFRPNERRVVLPLMAMIPVLSLLRVSFGFSVVLPAPVKFLQKGNSHQFNIMLQARLCCKFPVLSLA